MGKFRKLGPVVGVGLSVVLAVSAGVDGNMSALLGWIVAASLWASIVSREWGH